MFFISFDKSKRCTVCHLKGPGEYLLCVKDPDHQRWVCNTCIEKGNALIVRWNKAYRKEKGLADFSATRGEG